MPAVPAGPAGAALAFASAGISARTGKQKMKFAARTAITEPRFCAGLGDR